MTVSPTVRNNAHMSSGILFEVRKRMGSLSEHSHRAQARMISVIIPWMRNFDFRESNPCKLPPTPRAPAAPDQSLSTVEVLDCLFEMRT